MSTTYSITLSQHIKAHMYINLKQLTRFMHQIEQLELIHAHILKLLLNISTRKSESEFMQHRENTITRLSLF